jgi:hypothetical protein
MKISEIYPSPNQRTNFCQREPELILNAGYSGEGKEEKGYKRIPMEEEEGLGKQMRMTTKRIMTQD